MKIQVGNKIKWVSRAGVLTGIVKSIKLDLNAAGETIPWLTVLDIVSDEGGLHSGVCLPGTDRYFAMMKMEVL